MPILAVSIGLYAHDATNCPGRRVCSNTAWHIPTVLPATGVPTVKGHDLTNPASKSVNSQSEGKQDITAVRLATRGLRGMVYRPGKERENERFLAGKWNTFVPKLHAEMYGSTF